MNLIKEIRARYKLWKIKRRKSIIIRTDSNVKLFVSKGIFKQMEKDGFIEHYLKDKNEVENDENN